MDELIRVIEQQLPNLQWLVRSSDGGRSYYAHLYARSYGGEMISHECFADTPWNALNGAYCKAIAVVQS